MDENEIGTMVVDGAVHLHQDLGPGLLETVCVPIASQCDSPRPPGCYRLVKMRPNFRPSRELDRSDPKLPYRRFAKHRMAIVRATWVSLRLPGSIST